MRKRKRNGNGGGLRVRMCGKGNGGWYYEYVYEGSGQVACRGWRKGSREEVRRYARAVRDAVQRRALQVAKTHVV